MAYTKVEYNPVNWKNKSEGLITPLDKRNLNNMDGTIKTLADSLDVAYNELDVKKLDAGDGYKIITEMPTWDEKTGILKFKFYDGTEFAVDFNVEKIPVSFSMDEKGTITMVTEDGTEWTADVGTLTPNYVYDESERIAVTTEKSEDGFTHVKLDLKKGSITDDFLANNYLSSIIAETLKAQTAANDAKGYADNASQSASNAEYDAKLAQSYAIGDSGVRDGEDTDNAKYYKSQASDAMTDAESARDDAKLYSDRASSSALKSMSNASSANDSATSANASATSANASAENASASATSASASEKNASASAASASASEKNAKESKESAGESATSASTSANNASVSATNAAGSATSASESATSASASEKSASASATNAAGSATSASVSEANAKTYYEQTKAISESFAGTLRPKGTVTFSKLPSVASAKVGDMYNISDEFTTTTDFAEGAGNVIPLGSNVYKNSDGKWDVLAGSPVTGVKGNAETTYRRGNVNITKESIGLDKVENTADSEKKVSHASTANSADSAGKATNDSLNQTISSTYVKGVSITDHTLSVEKGDGKKTTYTIPDNDTDTNTTYTLTQDANDGHKLTFKASDGTTTNITIPDNDTKYDLNTMIGGLSTADSTPTDSNYLVSQSGTDTGYKRTPFSKILDYLKSKFSYNDLKDKPTIGNGTVTIKQNGTEKASFSMNQTGATTVELTDTNTNTWRDVVDGLDSTRTDASLSAKQGKVLNDKIDAIQIGGRNLLLETKDFSVGTSNVTGIFDLTNKIGAFTVLKAKCPSDRSYYDPFSQKLEFEPNTQYTLSFYAKADSTCIVGSFFYNIGNEGTYKDGFTQTAIGSKWKKYVITWTTGDTARLASVIPIRLQDTKDVWVYMYAVKFEKGNKATDWTPAPEDVEADATTKANNALDSAKSYTDTQVSPINTSVSKLQSQLGSHTVNSDVPANAKFTDTNTWRGIQDNLTSGSTSDSLSANQGKVLKGLIDGKTSNTGTITGITMNGASKGTSGVVDLGTVLTSGKQTSTSSADGGSNVYTFSDGSTITVKNGSKGSAGTNGTNGTNGTSAAWFTGTAVTGTATSATAFTVSGSKAGDMYLNTSTYNVYRASAANSWVYVCNIKGATGASGTNGTNGTNGVTPTIKAAAGSSINAVGTPSVTASTSGTTTTFTFNNLKGAKGDPGTNATTTAVASTSSNGLMSSTDKSKLDGIASGANKYSHPTYTAKSSGLYKITVDGTGHVSATTAVSKADITALGIPGSDTNTTYSTGTASTAGLTKLYTGTGTATDGTMTQDAIKSALDGKANSSHTHTKSQITDFPSSMPASDVYSWAKASSKPSYTASEVGALPISGGTITGGTISMSSTGLPRLDGNATAANTTSIGKNGFIINGVDTANDGAAIFMENGGTESNRLIFALGDDATTGVPDKDYIGFRYYNTSGNVTYESKIPAKSGTIALTSDIPTNTNQLTNGAGFITGITKEMVTGALGYTPANSNHTHNSFSGETKFVYSGDFVDPAWGVECAAKVSGNFAAGVIYEDGKKISEKYLTDITADNVKTALGYTPTRIRSSIFSGTMGTSAGDGGRIGSVSFGISAEDSGASVRILNFESNYSLTQCGDAKTSGTTVTVNVHSDTITSGSPSFGGRVLYVVGV